MLLYQLRWVEGVGIYKTTAKKNGHLPNTIFPLQVHSCAFKQISFTLGFPFKEKETSFDCVPNKGPILYFFMGQEMRVLNNI